MIENNRSIELFREHYDAKKLFFPVKRSHACVEEEYKMKECLLTNNISVFDVKSKLMKNIQKHSMKIRRCLSRHMHFQQPQTINHPLR